jgi:hypothetical protein
MAAIRIRPYRNCRIEHFPIAGGTGAVTATFDAGQVVVMSSGLIDVAGDNPESAIVGVAAEDAVLPDPNPEVRNTDGYVMKPVYVADEESEFVVPVESDDTPEITDVGVAYGLKLTSDYFYVNLDDTSTPVVYVTKVLEPGVAGGKVVVKFVNTTRLPFRS